MKVVPYNPKFKKNFIEMNKAWIEEMFVMEQEDIDILENFEALLAQGGEIFFTLDDNENVLACCMIEPLPNGEWEIAKFASTGRVKGAGSLCLQACIDYAAAKGIDKVLIVSNTKCAAAVHLYRKFGFTEIPVDKEKFPFDRANIAFERFLRRN